MPSILDLPPINIGACICRLPTSFLGGLLCELHFSSSLFLEFSFSEMLTVSLLPGNFLPSMLLLKTPFALSTNSALPMLFLTVIVGGGEGEPPRAFVAPFEQLCRR